MASLPLWQVEEPIIRGMAARPRMQLLNDPGGVAVDASGNIFFRIAPTGASVKLTPRGSSARWPAAGTIYPGRWWGGDERRPGESFTAWQWMWYGNLYLCGLGFAIRIRKVKHSGANVFGAATFIPLATNYDVVVTSPYGSVTSSFATITEVFGPGISAEPQESGGRAGHQCDLQRNGQWDGPFYYQWKYNGEELPIQTNATLTVTNVNTNKAGNYQVLVANPYASVTSSLAALAVVFPTLQLAQTPAVAGGRTH